MRGKFGVSTGLLAFLIAGITLGYGAGVTIITHGLNSNADDWVLAMAQRMPLHPAFPGTNFSCYSLDVAPNFTLSATRIGGVAPAASDSGEIIIKLDWGQLANNSFSTYQVAAAVLPGLLRTDLIPELGGHALAEFPLHLIGHSRGGSLICELSRLLGTNGIWVDHLTTLDPHPLNNDGFNDAPLYTVVDASARTYENVLFHDNYFQIIDFFVYGESVRGAYVRQLTDLNGGYGGIGGAHSDVHLWYHGTVDLRTPASDTGASVGTTQRQTWWSATERRGTNAGFTYSLIGRVNRLTTARAGFNQRWDLGAGAVNNRDPLGAVAGNWPNIVDLRMSGTNVAGAPRLIAYFQGPASTVTFGRDPDANPLNGNEQFFTQLTIPATGANSILSNSLSMPISGPERVFAHITSGTRRRYAYLPALPRLEITRSVVKVVATMGQTIVLQSSSNLVSWSATATNVMTQNTWTVPTAPSGRRFYRALSAP